MKILHTADWHFDLSNLDQTAGAIRRWIKSNDGAVDADILAHAGDLAVHRGHLHPHIALSIRSCVEALGTAVRARQTIVLSGNHDQSFHAERAGTVQGIFATSAASRIALVEQSPQIFTHREDDGLKLAIVAIPTPSKYMLRSQGGSDADYPALMATLIKDLIRQARQERGADRVIVMYHGTVTGARAGDELVMTAGMDLSVSRDAFAGADAVLLGHIHKPQVWKPTEALPVMAYCGAIAPLTWGDRKLQPSMLLWDVTASGVTWKEIPLPVVSQMLHYDLDFQGMEADRLPGNLREFLRGNLDVTSGARVRLKVAAPGDALAGITPALIEAMRQDNDLIELKVIPEATDSGLVRMDLEEGWAIPDAFERYLDFMGVEEGQRPPLRLLCLNVETMVEDQHLDARYDFQPEWIEAENWCQYRSVRVEFKDIGPVVAITGDNFAGKSNLSRILLFLLYKKQISGTRLADLVRKGEKELRVSGAFRCHGQLYELARTIKVQGDRATGDVMFNRIGEDGSVTPINEGTAGKTQDAIERFIGPLPLFLNTCFAGQNKIDQLLDLTPAEMKDVLMGVLQRNFEGRLEIAGDMLRTKMSEAEKMEASRSAWVSLATGRAEKEAAAKEADQTAVLAEAAVGAFRIGVEDAERLVERAMNEAAKLTALETVADGAAGDLAGMQSRLAMFQGSMTEATDAERRAGEIRDQLGMAPDMGQTAEERDAARSALQAAERSKSEDLAALQSAVDQAREERSRLQRGVVEARSAQERIEESLAAAHRAAGLLGDVPCGGGQIVRTTAALGPETVDAGACRFLSDATALAAGVPRLMAELEAAKIVHNEAVDMLADAVDAVTAAQAEVTSAMDVHRRKIEAATAALMAAQDRWDRATAAAQAHQAAAGRLAELDRKASGAAAIREAIEQAEIQASELDARVKRIRAEILGFGNAKDRLDAGLGELKTKKAALDDAIQSHAQAREARAEAHAALKQAVEAEARVAAIQKDVDTVATSCRALEFYRRAMHRDGLPFLLLEKFAIPGLQRLMNAYLENTPFRVIVSSERELQSGESRNAVNIQFVDHRGTHDKSAASGFQRTAIGMAAMAALADLNAEATGSKIWLTVQDEGFGTMTPVHLDGAKTMIRQIAQRRGWFVFISHVPGMADSADTEIAVIDDQGTSRIEIR